MSEKITVALVLGTAREGNYSSQVMDFVERMLATRGDAEIRPVRVSEHIMRADTLPPWNPGGVDETPTVWQEIAATADGFLFVIPEYNRGYPGEWKLLVDSLYKEYVGKTAGVVGVSDGMFGGARAVEQTKPILVELGLIPVKGALHVSFVKEAFNEEGMFADAAQHARAEKFLERFIIETKRQRIARSATIQ